MFSGLFRSVIMVVIEPEIDTVPSFTRAAKASAKAKNSARSASRGRLIVRCFKTALISLSRTVWYAVSGSMGIISIKGSRGCCCWTSSTEKTMLVNACRNAVVSASFELGDCRKIDFMSAATDSMHCWPCSGVRLGTSIKRLMTATNMSGVAFRKLSIDGAAGIGGGATTPGAGVETGPFDGATGAAPDPGAGTCGPGAK
mmetsp:Transcript_8062/g.14507  ORF Transcript_8062/g.14507 Transcript_8062/m.14507 type:complete len:200 (+) Transcript_8062:413-1012(+)